MTIPYCVFVNWMQPLIVVQCISFNSKYIQEWKVWCDRKIYIPVWLIFPPCCFSLCYSMVKVICTRLFLAFLWPEEGDFSLPAEWRIWLAAKGSVYDVFWGNGSTYHHIQTRSPLENTWTAIKLSTRLGLDFYGKTKLASTYESFLGKALITELVCKKGAVFIAYYITPCFFPSTETTIEFDFSVHVWRRQIESSYH